jgi:hemerythrin superfamily protein
MKTLVGHYQEVKDKLKSRLESTETTEQVVKIVKDEIQKLTDIDGEYILSLTPPQARLARTMLQSLSQWTGIMNLIKLQDSTNPVVNQLSDGVNLGELAANALAPVTQIIETQKNITAITKADFYRQAVLKQAGQSREVVSSVFAGGVAGTLEGGLSWGILGAVIGAVTGGAIAKVLKKKDSTEETKIIPKVKTIAAAKAQVKLDIDINKLLDQLYQALQIIDVTVASYGSKEDKTPKADIDNNLELLEYLQDLLAESLDKNIQLPMTVRRRIDQAGTILRRYGIEARVYEPEKDGDNWSMFYFEPSLDPEIKDYVTLKPALVKDNQVILPGSVIEPS